MEDKKHNYYMMPVKWLSTVTQSNLNNKITEMEDINIVHFGLKADVNKIAAAFIYKVHYQRHKLNNDILEIYKDIYCNYGTESLFEDGKFKPDQWIISELLKSDDKSFMNFGACSVGYNHFGFEDNNLYRPLETYRKFKNEYTMENLKYFSIKQEAAESVKKNQMSLIEFKLLAAIKSVIGKKSFAATSWEQLRGLMMGCQSQSDYKECIKSKRFLKAAEELTDYNLKKARQSLQKKELISFVHFRNYYPKRFFVSTAIRSSEQLTAAILKRRESLVKAKRNLSIERTKSAQMMAEGLKKIRLIGLSTLNCNNLN